MADFLLVFQELLVHALIGLAADLAPENLNFRFSKAVSGSWFGLKSQFGDDFGLFTHQIGL